MTLEGTRVRNFTILTRLGEGGMGEVYAAHDETLRRRVALKAIHARRRPTPAAVARFLREARILSRLDHPGICRIHDYVEDDDRDFLVLELIEGQTLRDAGLSLPRARRLEVAQRIAEVLVVAHTEGIVHRDLKPDNVMLDTTGRVKVLDFGLAMTIDSADDETADPASPSAELHDPDRTVAVPADHSVAGHVMGTPSFMSPEQARGEDVTPASDLYSFGVVLRWLFTRERAYEQTPDVATLLEHVRAARTRPLTGLDPDLARLIRRLESRSPASRPTAVETLERLQWIRRKPARRARRWLAAAVVAVVLLAGLKYTADLHRERQVAERHRAEAEDLIEFMLGDLSEKLAPVGRLDVLDDVGHKALAYFGARSDEELAPDDRLRLARAMSQIGQVRLAEGNLDAAHDAFQRSVTVLADLALSGPNNSAVLVELGAAHFWIGNVHFSEGNLDGAGNRFRAYLEVAERLLDLDPDDPEWQLEVAYAHNNLAALYEQAGDLAAALVSLDAAIAMKRKLVESTGADAHRSSLANARCWQGQILDARGDLKGALASFRAAEATMTDLAATDPENTEHVDLRSVTRHWLGSLLDRLGRDEEALEQYRADLADARRLAEHDPENADWQLGLAMSRRSLGLLLLRRGEVDDAARQLDLSCAVLADFAARESDNLEWARDHARALVALAELHLECSRPESALVELEKAAGVLSARDEVGAQFEPLFRGRILVLSGASYAQLGRTQKAQSAWEQARDLLEPLVADSRDDDVLAIWARLLCHLDRIHDARQAASTLAGMGYARRDFVALCERHGLLTRS